MASLDARRQPATLEDEGSSSPSVVLYSPSQLLSLVAPQDGRPGSISPSRVFRTPATRPVVQPRSTRVAPPRCSPKGSPEAANAKPLSEELRPDAAALKRAGATTPRERPPPRPTADHYLVAANYRRGLIETAGTAAAARAPIPGALVDWQHPAHATLAKRVRQPPSPPPVVGAPTPLPPPLPTTPLHLREFAAAGDEQGVCRCLRDIGVDDADDEDGVTPLMRAAANGRTWVASLLLERRAEPQRTNNHGSSSLHYAALHGHVQTCELLLRSRAFVPAANAFGDTPLHTAAAHGHLEVCKSLLRERAAVDAPRESTPLLRSTHPSGWQQDGWRPLHLAAAGGHARLVALLLEHRAEVDGRGRDGDTPLMHASAAGHDQVASVLLERGALPTARNKFGAASLHLAAGGGHGSCAALLLVSGGRATRTRDVRGETALDWAHKRGHPSIGALLAAHGDPPQRIGGGLLGWLPSGLFTFRFV